MSLFDQKFAIFKQRDIRLPILPAELFALRLRHLANQEEDREDC
jgi:hypothetical protein